MNADWHAKLYDVFCGAVALSRQEREAYLNAACAENATFRGEVERLLTNDPGPSLPDRIGHFRIRGKLGEGGMGTVYLAQREHHPHDLIALKVVRDGADSKEVLIRFEAEQKALSLLNHPNIARLFEAGVTTSGLPYFTMEYIPGSPITEFCDSNDLDTRARLSIFSQVCSAIDHAHKRGIIHRDIKPTNVIVHRIDGTPTPKIIDFGVAKAINFSLSPRTLFTEQGRLVGTPEYMSPEQAGKTATEVDHRTDIYSLGVLLYELLVGTTPIDGKTLRAAAWNEMVRLIREYQPPKPSTRRKTLVTGHAAGAGARGIDIHALPRLHRDDIDQITLKAIEKKPEHRYQSAAEMARVVDGHLRGEPLPWSVGSRWIRLRRHARHHRASYLRALVVVALVGLSTILVLWVHREHRINILLARSKECAKALDPSEPDSYPNCISITKQVLGLDHDNGQALCRGAWLLYKFRETKSVAERRLDSRLLSESSDMIDRYFRAGRNDYSEYKFHLQKCANMLQQGTASPEPARAACERALELAEEDDAYHPKIYLAALHAMENNFDRAVRFSEEATGLSDGRQKDVDEPWRLLGTLQLYLGQDRAAVMALERAMKRSEGDHRTEVLLARYHLQVTHDYKRARQLAEEKGKYLIPYYHRIRALARLRTGDLDGAISAAAEGIEEDPIPSFRHLIIAFAEARLGDLSKAKESFGRATDDRVWPTGLTHEKPMVTFDCELLWIDTLKELENLKEEASREIEKADGTAKNEP